MIPPPEKPSELILLALRDLELCEADPRYRIDMTIWHVPIGGKCEVCMAGGVLAKTLEASPYKISKPSYVGHEWRIRLLALDYLRIGNVSDASHKWSACKVPGIGDRIHADYHQDPELFKNDMRQLAAEYRAAGA